MVEITVARFMELVQEPIGMRLVAGEAGLGRSLRSNRIQKPGLALAGFTSFIHDDRIQIIGETELSYLRTLDAPSRHRSVERFLNCNVACALVTKGLPPTPELLTLCEQTATPLFVTRMTSSRAIRKLLAYLDDVLSPRCSLHGVLVDVTGVGVLITGASGIGKSECALDLVSRGHRLVADDVVEVRRRGEDLVGQAARLIQNLIEVRGLGIINIAELYGVAATRDHKRIELHVELAPWVKDASYDRTGLEARTRGILGIEVQSLLVPIHPGRNVAGLVEIAARNFLLHTRGHHAARELDSRMANATESLPLMSFEDHVGITDHIHDEVE